MHKYGLFVHFAHIFLLKSNSYLANNKKEYSMQIAFIIMLKMFIPK